MHTDFLFMPAQNVKQNVDIRKLKKWMTSAEILKLVTHDYAELLALSGPRNPYPGNVDVVQPGALADLILVDGNPLENLSLVADPQKRFRVIMKDGHLYKTGIAPQPAS